MNPSALLRFGLRLGVALSLLVLALRIALPEGGEGLAATLVGAWRSPLPQALASFAVAVLVFGVSFAVGALRFRTLLRGAGLDAGFAVLLRAYIVASFFNLVLPGAMLGDVYRFFDARREMGRGSEVLGMVVLERLLSLAALGSIGLVVAPFVPLQGEEVALAWALLALCALFVSATALALHPRANALLRTGLARVSAMAPGLAARAERSLRAVAGLSRQPRLLANAFALSLLTQWLPVFAVYALSLPLDAQVAWYWFAILIPFVTFASLLPISIGGHGVREILFVTLFGAVGMRPGVALALSLSTLAVAIVWAVVGLGILAVGRAHASEAAA